MGLIRTHEGERNYFLGNVGVRTVPSEALTVAGNINVLSGGSISAGSISGVNYFGTWQGDVLASSQVNVEGVDIKSTGISKDLFLKTTGNGRVVWDTTPVADTAGNVDGSGTANTLAKFTDSDTIGDSIVIDNGSLVTVGGDLSASGTITADTIVAHTLLSATNLDITYELSGFSVTGDISASGGLSAYNGYFVDKVGIGINKPDTTLHVCATDPRVRVDATAGNHPGFEISEAGSRCWLMYNQPGNSDALTFKSSADRVVITQAGNVGIGTISPGQKLTVAGTISGQSGVITPAICGTVSVFGPAVCGTTSVCSPAVCGTTTVCGGCIESDGDINASGTISGGTISDGYSCLDGSGSVCGSYGCFSTDVTAPAVCGSTSVCGALISDGMSCLNGSGTVCGCYGCFDSGVCVSSDICASGTVCGYNVCGTGSVCGYTGCFTGDLCGSGLIYAGGDICAGSGVVYGGSCVCGACVTDGYSCMDGSGLICAGGDVCASGMVYGYSCVCGYCITDGYSCMDGGGYVCAEYDFYSNSGNFCSNSGNVCAASGEVCGYYGCFDYLYKGSGSFNIAHPLESKKDTHKLVHSFIEGPQADNIYSGTIKLTSGSATVNIDNCAGMTEGTFVALNRCVRAFTTNETNWDPVKGSVSGNVLTVESCVSDSTADVSWMVIGERQDPHMYDSKNPLTNNEGQIIVEPEIPSEE